MKPIERTINLLNKMFENTPRFIMGSNGEYGWATCNLNGPLSAKQIDDYFKDTVFSLPEDYKMFLTIHNGGYLFETEADIKIELFSLEEMINFSAEQNDEEGLLSEGDYWILGQINECWIIVDKNVCKDRKTLFKNPYITIVHPSDGLDTSVRLNMNFERFLECAVIAQGENFWEFDNEFTMIIYDEFSKYEDVEV